MTDKIQTTEGNKLIEIFKGERELMPDGQTFGIKRGMPKKYENWYSCISINELQYHSSWDWLMPVVKKFNDICNLKSWYYHSIKLTTDIDCVWEETVTHLIWYNSQSK